MENKTLCTECGGRCCQNMPGTFHPDDFETLDVAFLSVRLQSGVYAVDCWEGSPTIYFLRPATTNSRGILDRSWGGQCVFLETTGCQLTHDDRPRQCRDTVPMPGGRACPAPTKYEAALWWSDHQELLLAAVKHAEALSTNIF